jgi:uncharacterized protein (TIGR02996 family)
MTDRESLLAAVAADPDNPLPRLVYADFLDETGDPDWAELIRLQNGYFKHWTNAEEMQERETELVEVVMARFPEVPGIKFGPPVRGFAQLVTCDGSDSEPEAGRAALASFPVTYYGLQAGFPDWLVSDGWLRRARVIDLTGFYVLEPYRSDLFASLDPTSLRALIWQDISLGDEDAEFLAAAPKLGGLLELCLADNTIGSAGCDSLIRSPYLTQLEYLDLRGNPVGDAVERLERRFGRALRLV